MKVLITIIVLFAIATQSGDRTEAASLAPLGNFFKAIGAGVKSGVNRVTTALVPKMNTALAKYTHFFPKSFPNFHKNILRGGKTVLRGAAKVGRSFAKPIKRRILDGVALSARFIRKASPAKFNEYAKKAFHKVFHRKQPADLLKAKNNVAGLATDLNLPFASDGSSLVATVQGGPDSPPKKKSKIGAILGTALSGVGTSIQLAGSGLGIAMQVQHMKQMSEMSNANQQYLESVETASPAGPSSSMTGTSAMIAQVSTIAETCTAVPDSLTVKDCITISDSDDESSQDPPVRSRLKYSNTLELQYEDSKSSSGTICRGKITNVADQRPGFVQAFQLQNVKQISLQPLEINRQVALHCPHDMLFPIPLSTLRQSAARTPAPSTLPLIPEVKHKGKTVLSWTGLLWDLGQQKDKSIIYNTCHKDSFFTHILLRGRLDPTFFDRNFIIPQHGPLGMIQEIAKEYRSLSPKAKKTTIAFNQYKWKELWIRTESAEYGKLFDQKKAVNYKGHELSSIVDRVKEAALKLFTFTCSCDGDKNIITRPVGAYAFTIEEIRKFSRADQQVADYKSPLSVTLNDAYYKWCKTCNSYVVNFIFTPSTSFMLYWLLPPLKSQSQYVQGKGNAYVFDLSLVPKKFITHELYYDTHAEFELAYISLSTVNPVQSVYHHLSFHHFNNRFYFYDDMGSTHSEAGVLTLFADPNQVISLKKLTIESLIYFRP